MTKYQKQPWKIEKSKDIFNRTFKSKNIKMNTLKFITSGNVDDGKSTLIGRLLYDSDSIHTDQLGILKKQTKVEGIDIDLSLITDGLRAEREQGITIDVAYKYFSTKKRKFIIADAPGHEQYTRNMITGASNVDLIILLIDARTGITTQTKRHSSIAALMGIKNAIVAINKIDLVDYDEDIYNTIVHEFESLLPTLKFNKVDYIPISAFLGDNVVSPSKKTPWYDGPTILDLLEKTETLTKIDHPFRFQVQYVIRPKDDNLHDYRGFAGKILSGEIAVGDPIYVGPNKITTKITRIEKNLVDVDHAFSDDNVILHIADDVDLSRGDQFNKTKGIQPLESKEISTWITWFDDSPMQMNKTYLVQHNHKLVRAKISKIKHKWNINTWEFEDTSEIKLNDIAQIDLRLNAPIFYDTFEEVASNGRAILIDENSHNTVGALLFYHENKVQ
jgi:sulfate adenylyltransferase subunit 1